MATRGRGQARECPLTGCLRTVRAGHLLCAHHWRKVPTALRLAYWKAWGTWQETMTTTDWNTYSEARQACIDSLEQP